MFTGRMLGRLGLPLALAALPLIAAAMLLVIAVQPTAGAVAFAEVVRKVRCCLFPCTEAWRRRLTRNLPSHPCDARAKQTYQRVQNNASLLHAWVS